MTVRPILLCAGVLFVLHPPPVRSQEKSETPPPKIRPDGAPAVSPSSGEAVHFDRDVMPLIDKLGCSTARCHGGARNGLRLSLFGAVPRDDFATLTKVADGKQINLLEPERSLLLLKITGALAHDGGKNIEADSPQHELILRWIAAGARWGDDALPKLASIESAPAELLLEKGKSRPLKITAVFSDGSRKDVTRAAQYHSDNTAIAAVSAAGVVQVVSPGETSVVVSYLRRFRAVRVEVPQSTPAPFPAIKTNNRIDEFVYTKLKRLGIPPSDLCTDQEFLRRVHLDVVGTLPKPGATRAFLSSSHLKKRTELIDQLLSSTEFADFQALKWGDLFRIKSEYPSRLWPNAVQAYHRWIRESIADNKPYDQFARELITSSGSNFRNPEANFYRAFLKRTPQNLGEVTALIFMGTRIGCARCHGHPTASWSLDDNVGLASFFARVRYKKTREWKEEIVYVNPRQSMRHPLTKAIVAPKFLDGDTPEIEPGEDPRSKFAGWLTSPKNPWFARNIVNRIWFWLLGRGIIHEPDDLRSTNLPENPDLLAYLENELLAHNHDLKHVYRLILNSRTYQLSAKTNQFNRHDVAHFSHYQVKRLGAETLLDAIGQITERWDTFRSYIPEPFVVMPRAYRATHLADGSIDLPFLQLFGRPPRDTAYELDRDLDLSMRQTLHLLNSSDVQNKISASPRLRRLMQEIKDDSRLVEELYVATLARFPTDDDLKRIGAYLSGAGKNIPESVVAEQKAARKVLARVSEELKQAGASSQAAEKIAAEARAAAGKAKASAERTALARKKAEEVATAKRQKASSAKSQAENLKKEQVTGEELAEFEKRLTAAVEASRTAGKASLQAQKEALASRTAAEKASKTLASLQKAAAEKTRLAGAAVAHRDRLKKSEGAAKSRLAKAQRKVVSAKAALRPRRDQAMQDILWALMNSREFIFNH